MFSFLKPDPKKQLQKTYEKLSTEAFQAQRNGDIRKYSELTDQAESIREQINQLEQSSGSS